MAWQDLFLIVGTSVSLTLLTIHDSVTRPLRTRVLYPVLLYDRQQRRILRRLVGGQADAVALPEPAHRRAAAVRAWLFHGITCTRCVSFWWCFITAHVLYVDRGESYWPAIPMTVLATWAVASPAAKAIVWMLWGRQPAAATAGKPVAGEPVGVAPGPAAGTQSQSGPGSS